MKTTGPVLATNSETDRAFNSGVFAVCLGVLGGLCCLYYISMLSFLQVVVWGILGVPLVAFATSILLAEWLGYADEAQYRSMRYAARLNHDYEE